MREDELPEGWEERPLGELLETGGLFDGPFGSSLKTSDYTESGVRVIRLENLSNLRFNDDKRTFISKEKYQTLKRHTVVEGDIIFGSFVDDATRVTMIPNLDTSAIAKADCFCIRPRSEVIDPRFLTLQLGASRTRDALIEDIHGATRPRITTRQLRDFPIFFPPLAEQKRIVAKVEELLASVNAARERLARVPAILKRFRQAVLAAACSGRLTEASRLEDTAGTQYRPLRDVVETLDQGWSPQCDTAASSSSGEWGVIKTTAVQPLWFDENENKRLPAELSPRKNLELRSGDLLVTRAGPRARAGITCLVRAVRSRLMICDKVYRLRPQPALASAEFLNLVLNEPSVLGEIEAMKTGISDSGVNLTQGKLLALEIPLPALIEQREVVRRVDSLFKLADGIEERLATATSTAEQTTQAILAKAFRGELVSGAEAARWTARGNESSSSPSLIAQRGNRCGL